MNIQKFIFKFLIVLSYILRLAILILPIAIVVVISKEGGWKYGFTFIQNSIEVALFVSFAIGFLVAMYHAVSYEIVGEGPMENYLKSSQSVRVTGSISLEKVKELLQVDELYKEVKQSGNTLTLRRKVHMLSADKIQIVKDADAFEVDSKPFSKIWFIDFGRNFKNVSEIAKIIKRNK
ncbi:MAG: hypothetical protein KJP21_01105 [Bacteroidia bacterium]|nr:hypothetical protein [Bacteroidia bacterium]NNJ55710.1 hypothetical protein [Bacteroidia bacterium]